MNKLRGGVWSGLWAVCLGLSSAPAAADFEVRRVSAQHVADRLVVNAVFDLALTEETERAVNQGVTLVVLTEVAAIEPGWLWDRRRIRHQGRARLRYHALSGYYIVDVAGSEEIETFRSLPDALKHIGNPKAVVLDWPSFARRGVRTSAIDVRSRLDINALPAPLRPTAYLSGDWQLGGVWTRWPVQR